MFFFVFYWLVLVVGEFRKCSFVVEYIVIIVKVRVVLLKKWGWGIFVKVIYFRKLSRVCIAKYIFFLVFGSLFFC